MSALAWELVKIHEAIFETTGPDIPVVIAEAANESLENIKLKCPKVRKAMEDYVE